MLQNRFCLKCDTIVFHQNENILHIICSIPPNISLTTENLFRLMICRNLHSNIKEINIWSSKKIKAISIHSIYDPFNLFHLGQIKITSLAKISHGIIKIWFRSGSLMSGTSGKTMNTPPFWSASNTCSNEEPTSCTVKTLKKEDKLSLRFWYFSLVSAFSFIISVSANQGQRAYALMPSSSQGFGREHFE